MRFIFADHTLDISLRELRRGATPVPVEPQVFDLLTYLVKNRDRVVTKDDLFGAIWGGRIVADSTLASRINAVRKAVGDSGEEQKLIRTIARRGVRFVGDVELRPADAERAQEGKTPNGKEYSPRVVLPQSERRGIAVLAFVNMSGEADQDYFSDGISDGAGRARRPPRPSPNARVLPRSSRTAKTPGRILRSPARMPGAAGSRTRSLPTSWRCASTRTSRWGSASTG